MTQKKVLIVAGEPSGDLHASNLVKDLKKLKPDLRFFGMGGSLLKDAGVDTIFDISKLALIGLSEVLKNIFTVGQVYKGLLNAIETEKPDLAILVDYPGFNLRLAKELKKRSIPVVYYISPQVWAWGRDRIGIIQQCVKKILVFFKFEEELYKKYGIDAEFVGHPLLDSTAVSRAKEDTLKTYGLSKNNATIAILPGSRAIEIKRLLPVMMRAASLIKNRLPDTQFLIAKYHGLPREMYEKIVKGTGIDVKIVDGDTYNVAGAADLAIVASGTATLETAIIGTPLIIVYKVNFITHMAYKLVIRIKFLGIVNIIAGKEVAPELLQYNATAQNISKTAMAILSDPVKLRSMREDLSNVKASLGRPGASKRAAQAILPLLQ
ncbi:MAG: lipid-A-disaccharide synthase [Candidatus Omnitrophica bacterium]|nr:lipid-A-disaccharide synthase [Candidatus Omnitrophota bacterium]